MEALAYFLEAFEGNILTNSHWLQLVAASVVQMQTKKTWVESVCQLLLLAAWIQTNLSLAFAICLLCVQFQEC